ncbi:MAG: hypothetical protein UX07_C0021G0006 [Parcubacteria group bacterium GW2011_GWA2_45_30]|nr:MAG: hypothetical protein UX07_C0021G0006 [Parcubacteria group bacterium GW2011_GWA2_45_30]
MKLIVLYGPPAVGKLTIAKELSRRTGYKIFHNHLTIDLVESIFTWGTKDFNNLVSKYRLELIEAAAARNVNLVFTIVYAGISDDQFIKEVVKRVKKHRGKVCFIRLLCSKKELIKRVKRPSRKNFGKIKNLKKLKGLMQKHNLFSTMPYANNITIDNTKLSPKQTARKIKKHFRL